MDVASVGGGEGTMAGLKSAVSPADAARLESMVKQGVSYDDAVTALANLRKGIMRP